MTLVCCCGVGSDWRGRMDTQRREFVLAATQNSKTTRIFGILCHKRLRTAHREHVMAFTHSTRALRGLQRMYKCTRGTTHTGPARDKWQSCGLMTCIAAAHTSVLLFCHAKRSCCPFLQLCLGQFPCTHDAVHAVHGCVIRPKTSTHKPLRVAVGPKSTHCIVVTHNKV